MPYSALADAVVVAHLGFVAFVALGGFLAVRHPRLLVLHVPAVLWGLGIVTVGWPCPLTGLEHELRERAGESGYDEGFVDRYLTGVVYPESYERPAQAVAGLAVVLSYVLVARAARRRSSQPSA